MYKNNDLLPAAAAEPLSDLCKRAVTLINHARRIAVNEVNLVQLLTYYTLGEWIVEVQQSGSGRAAYGKHVLETLSNVLNREFGKGFSVSTLTNIRKFYETYQNRISESMVAKFADKNSQPLVTNFKEDIPFRLS